MTRPAALHELTAAVGPSDRAAGEAARTRHAALAAPPVSLGALETLGERLSAIAGRCPPPRITAPALVIAAGDHGVHAQGVTPWPQEVTAMMVATFARGRVSANALADTVGATVTVVDVGVVGDVPASPRFAPPGSAPGRAISTWRTR
jgi:nicotinate-nucleotide--dimethylbenzimidazole phosphoribosyltransferase